jgi:hypothetical protein
MAGPAHRHYQLMAVAAWPSSRQRRMDPFPEPELSACPFHRLP